MSPFDHVVKSNKSAQFEINKSFFGGKQPVEHIFPAIAHRRRRKREREKERKGEEREGGMMGLGFTGQKFPQRGREKRS